jgi:hypothetical protein
MTEPAAPLPPDVVDELLSAALDGELDAAAAELGFTAAEAEARLAATPGTDERRAALAAARPALSVAPVPDDVRTRMIATALDAADDDELARRREQRGRRARIVVALSAAAAAVLVLVGVASLVASQNDDDANVATDAAGGAPTEQLPERANASDLESDDAAGADQTEEEPQAAAPAPLADATGEAAAPLTFGIVDDLDALRNRIGAELGLDGYSYDAPPVDEADRDLALSGADGADPCLEQLAVANGVALPPVLRGGGSFNRQPAEVLVFRGDPYVVLVVDTATCEVVASTTVAPEP